VPRIAFAIDATGPDEELCRFPTFELSRATAQAFAIDVTETDESLAISYLWGRAKSRGRSRSNRRPPRPTVTLTASAWVCWEGQHEFCPITYYKSTRQKRSTDPGHISRARRIKKGEERSMGKA